jgi:predicted MFS family arabinose efflux permease
MKVRAIAPLAIGTFSIGTDNFIIAGILLSMSHDLGVSLAVAGLQVTLFSLVYALGSPILAALTGKYERRTMLVASMALFAAANVLSAVSPGFGILLVSRVIAALAAGIYGPIASSTAAQLVEPQYRGRAVSIVTGGLTVALVIGVPLGVFISNLSNWRAAFWLVAGLAVVAAVTVATNVSRTPGLAGGPSIAERFKPVLRPEIGLTLLQSTLVIGSTFITYTYLGELVEQLHVSSGAHKVFNISTMLVVYGVAALAGTLYGGRSTDRIGTDATKKRAAVVLVVIFAAMSPILWTTTGVTGFVGLLLVALVWSVAGWSFGPAQFSRLAQISPQHMHLTFALNNSSIYIGAALGAAVGGFAVANTGADSLGLYAMVGEILGLALVLYASARSRVAVGSPAQQPAS